MSNDINLTDLQDSILIVATIQLVVQECLDVMAKEKGDSNSKVHAIANAQLLLSVKSFMDEWARIGNKAGKDDRISKVLRITSPFIKRIRKWSDLNTTRNSFIAHGFRDRDGRNVLTKQYPSEINIPNQFSDYILLCGCIFCAKQILITEFSIEYNQIVDMLSQVRPPKLRPGIERDEEAMEILNKLIEQSNDLKTTITP